MDVVMYDRDSLTVQLIGGRDLLPATFFQAVLMAEDRIWTSPPYLSRQDAQTTVDYLAHAIAYGECTECQGEPYLLSDIYPNGSEPELVWLCREHFDFEASLAEADR
jgi:hypothetical protein